MARNIEIKARIASVAALLPLVAGIADQGPFTLSQDDTFFQCPNGRLKLRAFSDNSGELIFYQRPDQTGPKTSFYRISPTDAPASLRDALTLAYGTIGRVRKQRTLFLVGRTRIHLDQVEGLGDFLELEVVLNDAESEAAGRAVADGLIAALDIRPGQLLATAYLDLLAEDRPSEDSVAISNRDDETPSA